MGAWASHNREYEQCRVVILGLDSAGKTTFLHKLQLGEVHTARPSPTRSFTVKTLTHQTATFTAWDVGGREKIRPLYAHYCTNASAILYIVDSTDARRFSEAREELNQFVLDVELHGVPLLVVANKQDLLWARSCEQVAQELDLHLIRDRKWNVVPASAKDGTGLQECLEWIRLNAWLGKAETFSKEYTCSEYDTFKMGNTGREETVSNLEGEDNIMATRYGAEQPSVLEHKYMYNAWIAFKKVFMLEISM